MSQWDAIEQRRLALEHDLSRWIQELDADPRLTLSQGILSRASEQFEQLLRSRLEIAATENPTKTEAVVAIVGQGKDVRRLTLGQCINVLLTLDQASELHPGRRLSPDGSKLRKIVSSRNQVLHGRVASGAKLQVVRRFLQDLLDICSGPLIRS